MSLLRVCVLAVVVSSVALALGALSASGAAPDTAYDLSQVDTPNPQPTGRFGERHAATDDIDGDGVNDYFVGALSESVGGVENAGRVYAISGRTRTEIYDILAPELQAAAQFGFFVVVLGDVDGDGKNDLAVGTDQQDTTAAGESCTPPAEGCNKDQGKAWVFSGGKGGRLLYAVNNPDPQPDGRFGSRIGRAGDVNGDGVPESIMGASNNDVPAACGEATPVPDGCRKNQGQAYIFNGRDGTLVRELNLPVADQVPATCPASREQPCGGFGLSVQGPGDVDGDGVVDQLVNGSSVSLTAAGEPCAATTPGCNTGQGAMYLFSGDEDGKLLARIDDPAPQAGATFGFQDAAPLSPGDVNGDGRADLFANGFTQNGPGPNVSVAEGRIWVFDGKATVERPDEHGVVLYEPKDPTPNQGGQCCFSLDKTDYNQDAVPDLYVGASPHHVSGTEQSGGTYVFDGRDGSLLRSLELPAGVGQPGSAGNLGSNLGWSVAAPGDLNGDGEPDFLAGATFQDVGANKDEGIAFVFLSNVPPSSPQPDPTPPDDDGDDALVRPNLVRPGFARAVQRGGARRGRGRSRSRASGRRERSGGRIVVTLRGRMLGNRGRPCAGRLIVGSRVGRRRVAGRQARMGDDCRYSVSYSFALRRLPPRLRPRKAPLVVRVKVRFQGNSQLSSDLSPTRRIKVRR